GGLERMKSAKPSSAKASSKSDATKSTRSSSAWRAALRRATRSAGLEVSVAVTRASPNSLSSVTPMQPAPAPTSNITGRPIPVLLNQANGLFDDQLGFRAWDQNIGSDLEIETEKFLMSSDVLQRLARGATTDHRLKIR